uniref:Uncharacterized protein n=1 Tax=Wrangelia sp. TaxID=2575620 RepID=A0A4D6X077_9FLOR|nr:hypothetical protein [Wrangelia sp.]
MHYIYTLHNFYPIINISSENIRLNQLQYIQSHKNIPLIWKIIIFNNGSFTQNLQYLTHNTINLRYYQKTSFTVKKRLYNMRCVWLENTIYSNLTFARSIWILVYYNPLYMSLQTFNPIGYNLVNSKIDIYKKIINIYYGYCHYIEEKFIKNQACWGRKYTLYYKNQSYITVQEFFSPKIIFFFT